MSLSISQIVASSFNAVVAENKKAANQWADSSFMQELERQGAIVRKSLGPQIEAPLDYRRNPDAGFLDFDLQTTSLTKTEIITAAAYDIAELSAPIVWSNKDEVQNPTENQKIALAAQRIQNALDTHDDLIEQALFATSTSGFLGLNTHAPTTGTGSDGGIDASTETWWRNKVGTYTDGTDIEAALISLWNTVSKGSGSKIRPTFVVSDGATSAVFEGSQVALQRYDSQDIRAAAKSLYFKTAPYVFSQYGGTNIYMGNAKNFQVIMSKEYNKELSPEQVIPNANGYVRKVYTALQCITNNRSRLGVLHV